MDLWEIAPELDRWVDNNCIVTVSDRVEAIQGGEAMWAEVVAKKLVELSQKQNAANQLIDELRKLLSCTAPDCAAKEALILIKQYKADQAT